jgi:hypothetical protein
MGVHPHLSRRLFGLALVLGVSSVGSLIAGRAAGQDVAASNGAAAGGAAQNDAARPGSFRHVVPGIERTIPPEDKVSEKTSEHDLLDILKSDPSFGERPWSNNLAKKIRYQHETWTLEFTFKPMRFIEVDLPNDAGRFDRKTIWYLVYHIRNPGTKPVRFVPRFLLYSWDTKKYYPDRLVPLAVPAIQRREDPRRKLLDSVAISETEIPPWTEDDPVEVYGVATWHDIDPRTDRFSVYLQGLSNAYFWVDDEELAKGTRKYYRKTLQLNFWRPGDDRFEHEREIRYGIPGEVDYQWIYK